MACHHMKKTTQNYFKFFFLVPLYILKLVVFQQFEVSYIPQKMALKVFFDKNENGLENKHTIFPESFISVQKPRLDFYFVKLAP